MTERETPSAIEATMPEYDGISNDDLARLLDIEAGRSETDRIAKNKMRLAAARLRALPSSERASVDPLLLQRARWALEGTDPDLTPLTSAEHAALVADLKAAAQGIPPSIAGIDFGRADKLALDALTYESGSLTGEERKALARAYRALRSLSPTTAEHGLADSLERSAENLPENDIVRRGLMKIAAGTLRMMAKENGELFEANERLASAPSTQKGSTTNDALGRLSAIALAWIGTHGRRDENGLCGYSRNRYEEVRALEKEIRCALSAMGERGE